MILNAVDYYREGVEFVSQPRVDTHSLRTEDN